MKLLLLAALAALLVPCLVLGCALYEYAQAATTNLADCVDTTVINAISAASDGDTLKLPTCTVTWDDIVQLPTTKGVTLRGNGTANTIITDATSGGYSGMIDLRTTASYSVPRVSNFTIRGGGGANQNAIIYAYGTGGRFWNIY
jgi:hypothetical protein